MPKKSPVTKQAQASQKEHPVQFEKFFWGRQEAAKAFAVSVRMIDYFISERPLVPTSPPGEPFPRRQA